MKSVQAEIQNGIRPLEWLNFFMADVQTGLGPFVAAYLAESGWRAGRVGWVLTLGGLVTVLLQSPAGAVVDAVHRKRLLVAASMALLFSAAALLLLPLHLWNVIGAQLLIGGAGPFLGPAVAAITLGIAGAAGFDRQFGRNQSFNSAGNVFTALLVALVSYLAGDRAIFIVSMVLVLPALLALFGIPAQSIDYEQARGGKQQGSASLRHLAKNRVLMIFLLTCFLFHLANAAMLPQLGEMLSRGRERDAASFMSACIIVTQCVITISAARIGRWAQVWGRKPLLLAGFAALPVRGVLYALAHATPGLIAIQLLDGVANAIFGVVSLLVIADLTRGTGRFNLAAGVMGTAVGTGAALSTTVGGQLIAHYGFRISFLGLAAIAAAALLVLWRFVPETLHRPSRELVSSLRAV